MNRFHIDEWPVRESVSFEDYSIGEEQSTSIVTALEWSPPGLAKHRRSVLAVLTSNLILSLWAADSDPTVNENWKRVIVLYNAFEKSWERRCLSKNLAMPTGNALARKLRVRSMAWAPQIRRKPEKCEKSFETTWGVFVLAVTNDDGEIIFLLISSPYTTSSTAWDCNIATSFFLDETARGNGFSTLYSTAEKQSGEVNRNSGAETQLEDQVDDKPPSRDKNTVTARPSLFRSAFAKKCFFENIAWGPWRVDGDAETLITLSSCRVVIHCIFRVLFPFPLNTIFSCVPRFYFKKVFRCERDDFNLADRPIAWQNHVSCSPYYHMRVRNQMVDGFEGK